jgi:type II secretory pathway component PulC
MELFNTITNNRFWSRHGLQAGWAFAVLILLVAVAKVGWTAYQQTQIKQANYQAQSVAPIARANQRAYNINDIVGAKLFGDPKPKIIVKKNPKTTLDLTLQGTLWASDPSLARAIIMTGKRKSELYSIGENIKGAGASVKEILNGEVLLNRNGATESLPLVRRKSRGKRQIISYTAPSPQQAMRSSRNNANLQASMTKPRSPNGAPRKIRKPNFSGLDRTLKKMGEI